MAFDLSKIKLSDINSKNIRSFIEGTVNNIKLKKGTLDNSIVEMIESRIDKCPECKEKGSCVVCGCDYKGMIASPTKSCPKGRWGSYDVYENIQEEKPKVDNVVFELDLSQSEEHEISTLNTTGVSIVMKEILVSCNCTTILDYQNNVVQPNDYINLKIHIDKNRLDIDDERLIILEFASSDVNKPLSVNKAQKTLILKRVL